MHSYAFHMSVYNVELLVPIEMLLLYKMHAFKCSHNINKSLFVQTAFTDKICKVKTGARDINIL